MQILSVTGEEFGTTDGLGLIPGYIRKIKLPRPEFRLPHVGWNDVCYTKQSILWNDINENSTFYFAHTYAYHNCMEENIIGVCEYGCRIVSAVQKGRVFGVQFHPEKSQKAGLKLLKNFVELC
jgi:glutamine amidotransferase